MRPAAKVCGMLAQSRKSQPERPAASCSQRMVRSPGTSFLINFLKTMMGDEFPRTYSEDDFARWYSTLQPPKPTIVGEALPAGAPTMASKYGVFGAKALTRGVPGDENYTPAACIDAETRPASPCEATGECQDLQDLATRYEDGMRIARALELNAINAMQVAQVLLKRVDKAAVNLTRMPELSHFSAGEPNGPGGEPWPLEDQLTLTVRGPLVHGDHGVQETDIDEDYLIRWMARNDSEHRTVEYLQRAEGNRPLQLIENLGRVPIFDPLPSPTPNKEYLPTTNPTMLDPMAQMTMLQQQLPAVAVLASASFVLCDAPAHRHRQQQFRDFLL
ncbi:hypothetical protein AK812_SmicGene11690 [Symbiodinium microadriaticum]|uniref:Uncharacterized protein n=1 Tax=Symbiodinium microadriaticum TaxID=2951 RepID=A0A1Q9ECK9_SYMMI|nr:hypothetical protein AK812_SmicGene11690 [Symbiodinium microadriaticum]